MTKEEEEEDDATWKMITRMQLTNERTNASLR